MKKLLIIFILLSSFGWATITMKANLKKALELSPSNSVYLSELGYIYGAERKLSEALELYNQAEEFANTFTPEGSKEAELA